MFGRYSFIDGVPFAINPIFVPTNTEKDVKEQIETAEKLLNSDLSRVEILLKSKFKLWTEVSVFDDDDGVKQQQQEKMKKTRGKLSERLKIKEANKESFVNHPNPPVYSNNFSNTLLEPTKQSKLNTPLIASKTRFDHHHQTDMFNSSYSDTLDPFNDMELKTINDMEELKTILHNHQIDQNKQKKNNNNNELLSFDLDNYGLPKVSFIDLDINSNKL